jgi:hypothetical protein
MSEVTFGTLQDVNPREAWRHEALHFTPWLSANLDRLGDAIGRKLELIAIESPLPSADDDFSADILARDLSDGSNVLIENQLERSDHGHLGQILTYLAGLQARTIVWISPHFREAHLSAIKWLNDNTNEGFAFFAVKLRVVRIGESPIAPLFDVLARPNNFERHLKDRKAAAEAVSDNKYFDFWSAYLERFPDDASIGFKPLRTTNQWLPAVGNVVVGIWMANECGVYVRGRASVPIEQVVQQLAPFKERLEASTGARFRENESQWLLVRNSGITVADRARWPEAFDWIHQQMLAHMGALRQISELRGSTA